MIEWGGKSVMGRSKAGGGEVEETRDVWVSRERQLVTVAGHSSNEGFIHSFTHSTHLAGISLLQVQGSGEKVIDDQ